MKILHSWVLFVLCITSCLCGEHPDGESVVHRAQDALGNYRFGYSIANNEGEHFREEGTDTLGRVIGSYGLKHEDGRHRVVDYIADKDGFRASIRSNEPGVISAEAAGANIVKEGLNIPLNVAATSNDNSRQVFGRRLDPEVSKVTYADEDKPSNVKLETDEFARESRQRNFDDYRPLSPVAYYPKDIRSPLSLPGNAPTDQSRSPRVLKQDSEASSKPLDAYFPPIDPHTAIRRPAYYLPKEEPTEGNFYPTSTSRKPYLPPYGGFDDDEPVPPTNRRPGIAVHREPGPNFPISTPSPILPHDARRFPSPIHPENRNFDLPRFPPSSSYPSPPDSVIPHFPNENQDIPPNLMFNHPSYDGISETPNFVLRAVPIPNGIQAVRVDPATGRVYERLVYPLFLRHDGQPDYDRNILLHNDDVSDDDAYRYDDHGYVDMPYQRTPYRGVRNQPPNGEDVNRYGNSRYNRSYVSNEFSLSEPSAADVGRIKAQLALVEGFNGEHLFNNIVLNQLTQRDPSLPRRERFDVDSRQQYDKRIPGSRIRSTADLLSHSSEEDLALGNRSKDELSLESSKTVISTSAVGGDNSKSSRDEKVS